MFYCIHPGSWIQDYATSPSEPSFFSSFMSSSRPVYVYKSYNLYYSTTCHLRKKRYHNNRWYIPQNPWFKQAPISQAHQPKSRGQRLAILVMESYESGKPKESNPNVFLHHMSWSDVVRWDFLDLFFRCVSMECCKLFQNDFFANLSTDHGVCEINLNLL